MQSDLETKRRNLFDLLRGLDGAVVAYSGGVDSALLAAAAHEALGERSVAVTAVSPSLAKRELDEARALAGDRGWNHLVIETHEIGRESYARNDADRCYWCKTELFEVLDPIARARDAALLVGTNVDDLGDYRPGQRAARERGVRAPFVEVGLSKLEVRLLSERAGLPTADKPAAPCLASRLAYGVRVTPERLRRVDQAEEIVRSYGFDVLRVRDHGDLARVEVPPEHIERLARSHAEISGALRKIGFRYVTLDMTGFRSGSMNEMLATPTIRDAR